MLAEAIKFVENIIHALSILTSKVNALVLEINKPKKIQAARDDESLYSMNTLNYERLKENVGIDENLKNFSN
uniref:Mediator complex subunit 22 n=1 Tax=Strongyloides venezuelensis TaxID=75913 RepID=A0A0K0G5I8_STRVS